MKPDQIYQQLKELAEKMDIQVLEKSFKNVGIHVKSGLCKVKGEQLFIMDKHKSIQTKIELLAGCLGKLSHDDIYMIPMIRDLLEKYK